MYIYIYMQINIHFHSTTVPVGYRQFFGDVCPPAASAGGGGGGQLGLKASERERGRTSGFSLATETYRTGFQKKNQGEDGDSLRKSYLFPNVFVTNLQFKLNSSSMSPRFPFFCCFVATQPSIRNAHKWCEGTPEAPGSKTLPQWTLDLRVYVHTCRQTKEM